MKADPGQQWKLLDLAELDTRAAQIAHRRANLPEAQASASARAAYENAEADVIRTRTALGDSEREVEKAQADAQLVRDRIKRTTARLDDGSASPKQLQSLQGELESLERRARVLEDEQASVIERRRSLQTALDSYVEAEPRARAALDEALDAERRAVAELDENERTVKRMRTDLLGGISSELIDLYEQIRSSTGMGAAAVLQRRCGGCNLEILGEDRRRISAAPDDAVLRCENCSRILVRTSQSDI